MRIRAQGGGAGAEGRGGMQGRDAGGVSLELSDWS